MDDPASYFRRRGYSIEFEHCSEDELESFYLENAQLRRKDFARLRAEKAIGPVLANLVAKRGTVTLRAYGTGETERDAAQRALERWRTEQGY